MQDMYAMLADYGSKMRADDEVVYADLQECVKSFASALERATTFTQENHVKHTANLNSDAAAVLEAAQDLSVECMSGQFDDATAEPSEMRKRLASMEKKVCSVHHLRLHACAWSLVDIINIISLLLSLCCLTLNNMLFSSCCCTLLQVYVQC